MDSKIESEGHASTLEREAAERLQLALDAGAIVGTWVWDIPTDKFTADERFAEAFGLPVEDCRGGLSLDQVKSSIHDDDLPRVDRAIAEALDRGGAYRCEYRVRREDGLYRWIEASGRVELGADGSAVRFPGVLIDIEARRATEAERDRLSVLLRAFTAAVPGVVYAKDREGRLIVANHGTTELIGKPPELYIGRTDLEVLEDKDQARVVMETDRRIMESGVSRTVEEDVRLADGSPAKWLSVKSPFFNESGEVIGLIGSSLDVTDRINAERALMDSEARLRDLNATLAQQIEAKTQERDRIWNLSRDMFGVADSNGIWININPAWSEILGWSPEEIIGRTSEWMEHPDDREKTRAEVGRLAAGNTTFEFENRFRTAGGDYRILSWTAVPQDGLLYCVTRDVTDARRQAAALHEHIVKQGRAWDRSPDLLSVIDLAAGTFDRVNPAWTTTLGWSIGELEGALYTDFVNPDDMDASRDAFEQVRRGEPVMRFENRYRDRDGEWRWLSWVAFPEDGKLYSSARDITVERAQTEALAQRTRERDQIWSLVPDLLMSGTLDGRLLSVNPAWSEVLGYDEDTLLSTPFWQIIHPDYREASARAVAEMKAGRRARHENQVRTASGDYRWFDWVSTPVGNMFYAVARDITDLKLREAELELTQTALRQSQKMEAVGQLTGGLAHDFNNLLAGISGSLEMIATRIAQGRLVEVDRYMVAAQGAAKRAAALTHRLLAFSRRQTLDPKPTATSQLVTGMEELIRRTVGPAISVETVFGGGVWNVLVDPNQLENALLNLCINARDAMPDGGKLTIETANRWLDTRAARERDLPPGQYVSLCVSDNGTGMTPDVVEKAFDPFYTTKPIGVGTGLGLSMIYGFARQSGGQVRIYSEVGKGTMVCIYLPRYLGESDAVELRPDAIAPIPAKAGETVLVIDDEPLVRMLIVDVLEDLGYTALEADDGPSGMKLIQSDVHLDLLITDVGLPNGMNGRQVADAARQQRPGLKVLFVTGYAENAVLNHGHLDHGMQVITKPFEVEELTRRVREIITSD